MRLQRHSSGHSITLNPDRVLGAGGEARIYEVPQDPNLVAKVYHKPSDAHTPKLLAMLENPPTDPMVSQGGISFAWPVDLLYLPGRKQQVAGFLMPRVQGMRPIIDFYNPKTRRKQCPSFNYLYLHRTARNLAAAVGALHHRGYVVGDVNESNILVTDTALATLVDIDSIQVRHPQTGVVYRCPVGKPEFTPPELQGKPFAKSDRTSEHDLFGLAVLIFQLLMEGTHPFAGIFQGHGDPPPYEVRIAAGHFTYAQKQIVPYRPMPLAPAFEMLHPPLQELFQRCFEQGHHHPAARPDAHVWMNALQAAEQALTVCSTSSYHYYSRHLSTCPWCERTAKLKGRDPFPSPQALQREQALATAPKQTPLPPANRKDPRPAKRHRAVAQGAKPVVSVPKAAVQTWQLPQPISLPKTRMAGAWSAIAQFGLSKPGIALQAVAASTIFLSGIAGISKDWSWSTASLSWQLPQNAPIDISLANTVVGHFGNVGTFAVRPDGQTLVSSGSDGTIKVWNLLTGDLLQALSAWKGCCTVSLAISADSRMLLSGGGNGTINVWDLQTGKLLQVLSGHSGAVGAVALSEDSQTLVSGGGNGILKIWNFRRGEELRTLNGHTATVESLAISPDSKTLVSGGADGAVKVWDLQTGRLLNTLAAHSGTVSSLAIIPSQQVLASGSTTDNRIKLWDLQTGKLLHTLSGHSGAIGSIAISPDGQTLVSGSWDGSIKLWEVATGKLLRTLSEHSGKVWSVAISPDGRVLVSGSADYTIKIYRLWPVEPELAKYKRYMISGYDATARRNYRAALNHFQKALNERPGDRYATAAIQNVETYLQTQQNYLPRNP